MVDALPLCCQHNNKSSLQTKVTVHACVYNSELHASYFGSQLVQDFVLGSGFSVQSFGFRF